MNDNLFPQPPLPHLHKKADIEGIDSSGAVFVKTTGYMVGHFESTDSDAGMELVSPAGKAATFGLNSGNAGYCYFVGGDSTRYFQLGADNADDGFHIYTTLVSTGIKQKALRVDYTTLAMTIYSLIGTGTRMVVANAAGILSTQAIPTGGGGDASTNTAVSVDGEHVLFSGTGGKTLKRDTLTAPVVKSTAGVFSAAVAGTDYAAATEPLAVKVAGDIGGTATAPTVLKINGVAFSGLATGLLKNTTTTGVPSIAVAGTDYALPNANTTGSAATLTTPRTIAGVSFNGSANITIASTNLSDTASIALVTATQTLTNKRINPRVATAATATAPAPASDTTDEFILTALATAAAFANPTGTPVDGQLLLIRIKDNAVARAITWGTLYLASGLGTLLTTTVVSKTHLIGFCYDATAVKWVCIASDPTGY